VSIGCKHEIERKERASPEDIMLDSEVDTDIILTRSIQQVSIGSISIFRNWEGYRACNLDHW
jgi:hypothetical protein